MCNKTECHKLFSVLWTVSAACIYIDLILCFVFEITFTVTQLQHGVEN
jgi:hypothetical protein